MKTELNKTAYGNVNTKREEFEYANNNKHSQFCYQRRQSGAFFENKCEHQLKDIRFYLKTEQCKLGGNIAPFLGLKTDQNEDGLV